MNTIDSFCDELNSFLKDQFEYKRHLTHIRQETISVNRKKIDLYVRYKQKQGYWGEDALVLARIGFDQQKKGHGTSLLKFLVSLADKYQYTKIGIEQANKNSEAFAKKYGFEPSKTLANSYITSVESLKVHFAQTN